MWHQCVRGRINSTSVNNALCKLAIISAAALNSLHSESAHGPLGSPTSAQATALRGIISRTLDMWDRLVALGKQPAREPGAIWSRKGSAVCPLKANLVDTPISAAQCDPLPRLPPAWRACVTDATVMFPRLHDGLARFPKIRESERAEYIKIIVAQIKAGKLALASFWADES